MRDKQTCYGGFLGWLGIPRRHFFSNDYGHGDRCWRRGCGAQWDWAIPGKAL